LQALVKSGENSIIYGKNVKKNRTESLVVTAKNIG